MQDTNKNLFDSEEQLEFRKLLGDELSSEVKEKIIIEMSNDVLRKKSDFQYQGGFLLKQRAFLKVYLIMMAENDELYGLEIVDKLKKKFDNVKYVPGGSEVYKCLYHLMDLEVVTRRKEKIQGTKRKEVQIYSIADTPYARGYCRAYKQLLNIELNRSKKIIEKGLEDLNKSSNHNFT